MEEISKLIVFTLNLERYGVNIKQVRSIEKIQRITNVPRTPNYIKGVLNIRGVVTPIIDLKEHLHINQTDYTDDSRILIINIGAIQAGIIVDSATEVIDINPTVIEAPPEMIGSVTEDCLLGVAILEDMLLILLDLEQVLKFEELNELKEAVKVS